MLANEAHKIARDITPEGMQRTRGILQSASSSVIVNRNVKRTDWFHGVFHRMNHLLSNWNLTVTFASRTSLKQDTLQLPYSCLLVTLILDFQISQCERRMCIVLQTEQLAARDLAHRGDLYYDQRQKCKENSRCVLWEFSETNLSWMKSEGSGLLSVHYLPAMFQIPYDKHLMRAPASTMSRHIDVAFFGSMTPRRKRLYSEFERAVDFSNFSINFGTRKRRVALQTYGNALTCISPHAYHSISGLEYVRLFEMIWTGCQPILEDSPDFQMQKLLSTYGDIYFASGEELLSLAMRIARNMRANPGDADRAMKRRLTWWYHESRELNYV